MGNELQIRKNIRLYGYDYSSAGYYFITICVKDRKELLGKVVGDDAHIVPPIVELSEYGIITEKYINNINKMNQDIFVDKYIIMPNHIHMILVLRNAQDSGTMRASSPTASKIPGTIRSMKILVTKECGFSFWQRSFHDHIIRDEAEYRSIWQYIDVNPALWDEDMYHV